jgi:hypothetical protein
MYYYNDFIRSIHEEIGEQAGYSYEYLAYWFVGNYNLGRLNSLIGTCFSGSYETGVHGELTSYSISPEMGGDEEAVYQKIFEIDFYSKQARNVLAGAASYGSGIDWISVREGDSSITRVNKNEVAKSYKSMVDASKSDLQLLVNSYLKFRATPQQVAGDDVVEGGYYVPNYSYDKYRSQIDVKI